LAKLWDEPLAVFSTGLRLCRPVVRASRLKWGGT
jgi:hypothetical protein